MDPASKKTGGVVVISRCAWTLYNFRRNLLLRLQRERSPVVTMGARLDGFETQLAADGIAFVEAPVPIRGLAPIGDLRLLLVLYLRLRRLKPAVVHLFTIKPVIYGTIAAAMAGVPARVCTITGLGHAFTDAGGGVRLVAETLYRIALSFAHVVFFQNPVDRDVFIERRLVAPEKTRLVAGSGVSLERFAHQPLRPGLPDRPVRFLMLSRLIREKGVLEFIEAAESLAKDGVRAEFRLAGAQESRNPTALDETGMARLAASPIDWIGPVRDVREELIAADVVVLPSYREGLPRSLLEAMAIGRPIITTDAPGCREVVRPGVNGLSVPVRDPVALAKAMAYCAANPDLLQSMGDRGREIVIAEFDEEAIITRTLEAYDALLEDRHA